MSNHLDDAASSGYLDGALSHDALQSAKAHLAECPACRERMEAMRQMIRVLREIPPVEPPAELNLRIRQAIAAEQRRENNHERRVGRVLRGFMAAAAAVVIVTGALTLSLGGGPAGIENAMDAAPDTWELHYDASWDSTPSAEMAETESATSDEAGEGWAAMDDTMPMPEEAPMELDGALANTGESFEDESQPRSGGQESLDLQKIIYTAHCTQTTYQFAEDKSSILTKVSALGGFVQYNTTSGVSYAEGGSGLHGEMVLRIPQQNYTEMMRYLSQIGFQQYVEESAENISQVYSDENIRLQNLQAQRDALLELMEKAEALEDVLLLQTQLNEISTQIEQSQSDLRNMDQQVSYATINVTLEERQTTDIIPVSKEDLPLGQRMQEALYRNLAQLRDGASAFLVGLVGAAPFLGILALIAVISLGIILLARKHNKKSPAGPPPQEESGPSSQA